MTIDRCWAAQRRKRRHGLQDDHGCTFMQPGSRINWSSLDLAALEVYSARRRLVDGSLSLEFQDRSPHRCVLNFLVIYVCRVVDPSEEDSSRRHLN